MSKASLLSRVFSSKQLKIRHSGFYWKTECMRLLGGCLMGVVVLNSMALSFFEKDEIVEAKGHAIDFALNAEFEFPEYRMVADITAEASPESEYLFRSKATMEILKSKEFRVESLMNVPKLIADDRIVKSNGGIIYAGPFTRFDKFEWLCLDNEWYDLQGKVIDFGSEDVKRQPLDLSEPIKGFPGLMEMANIQPFDWPLCTASGFDRSLKDRDMYKYLFGKDRLCVFASSAQGLLETHWVRPSNRVAGVDKITFERDLIVSRQLYVYSKPIDIKNIDLTAGWLHTDSHTIWEKKGSWSYPKKVVMTMRQDFGKPNAVQLVVDIGLFCPGDREFDSREKKVQQQIDEARKRRRE